MTGSDGTDRTPVEAVVDAVSAWPGVSLGPHEFRGREFLLGDYEFGHVHHGWQSLHVNYPRRLREHLIETDRTAAHPHFPDTGWTSFDLRRHEDVPDALWLLRVSYLYRALTRRRKPAGRAVVDAVDVAAELDDLDASEAVREVFADVRGARA